MPDKPDLVEVHTLPTEIVVIRGGTKMRDALSSYAKTQNKHVSDFILDTLLASPEHGAGIRQMMSLFGIFFDSDVQSGEQTDNPRRGRKRVKRG